MSGGGCESPELERSHHQFVVCAMFAAVEQRQQAVKAFPGSRWNRPAESSQRKPQPQGNDFIPDSISRAGETQAPAQLLQTSQLKAIRSQIEYRPTFLQASTPSTLAMRATTSQCSGSDLSSMT
jgi:hypothetical protein